MNKERVGGVRISTWQSRIACMFCAVESDSDVDQGPSLYPVSAEAIDINKRTHKLST